MVAGASSTRSRADFFCIFSLFVNFLTLHVNKSACVGRSVSGRYALERLESCAYFGVCYAILGGRGRGREMI